MNRVWTRILKPSYRKEPISSFVLTVGAVDAVIGGVGDRWPLMALGLGTAGVALALRWWMMRQRRVKTTGRASIYYLPAQPSRPQLPDLSLSNRKPPTGVGE
jgi:hypothetical protein